MFKIYAIPLMNVGFFFLVDWGSILEIYCYSIIKQYQRISHKNLKKKPWISVPSYLYLIRSTLTALTNKQFNIM